MTVPDWRALERAALEAAERNDEPLSMAGQLMLRMLKEYGYVVEFPSGYDLTRSGREHLAALREEDGRDATRS